MLLPTSSRSLVLDQKPGRPCKNFSDALLSQKNKFRDPALEQSLEIFCVQKAISSKLLKRKEVILRAR